MVLLLVIGAAAGGCSSGGLKQAAAAYGSVQPDLAIRTFLDAADARDYVRMASQFGTSDGPAERKFGANEMEQRMIVLAELLRHGSYEIRRADRGRLDPDREWYVADMSGTRRGTVSVPIAVAETSKGRWFVEEIDVTPLTRQNP